MDIPKFHETFVPILETLADAKIIQHRELLNKIVAKYY
jgi:restriction system protein